MGATQYKNSPSDLLSSPSYSISSSSSSMIRTRGDAFLGDVYVLMWRCLPVKDYSLVLCAAERKERDTLQHRDLPQTWMYVQNAIDAQQGRPFDGDSQRERGVGSKGRVGVKEAIVRQCSGDGFDGI